MPEMPKHLASPTLAHAWRLRAEANATLRCPSCGAKAVLPNRAARREAKARGEPAHAAMHHNNGCVVSDEGLRQAMRAGMN